MSTLLDRKNDLTKLRIPADEHDHPLPCQADRECSCGATSLKVGKDGERTLVCTMHARAMIDGARNFAERQGAKPEFIQFVPLWCISMAQQYLKHECAPSRPRGKMCRMPNCKDFRKRGYDFCARCLAAIKLVVTDAGRTDLIPMKKETAKPAESDAAVHAEAGATETPGESKEEATGSEPVVIPETRTDEPATAPMEAEPVSQAPVTTSPVPAPQVQGKPASGAKAKKAKQPEAFQPPPNLKLSGGTSAHHVGFGNSPFRERLAKFSGQASAAQNG